MRLRSPSVHLIILAVCVPVVSVEGRTLHVAPTGKDSWSGALAAPSDSGTDGPLASLAGARDAIRRLKGSEGLKEPVEVVIQAGVYRLGEPFILEPRDSGTETCPITYRGADGARPVISGGRAVAGWRREGKLFSVEIPEVREGKWDFGALWIDGERRTRARSPNEGWFRTAGKAPPRKDPATGRDVARDATAFRFQDGDIKPWDDVANALVVVYHSWETSIHRIASVDVEGGVVEFTGPAAWAFETWGPSQRYHVENVREALDAPGEWYVDRKTGTVLVVPFEGEDLERAEAIAPVARQLVVLSGDPEGGRFVDHVRFRNLRLLHTDWPIGPGGHSDAQAAFSVPGAIQAKGARWCSVSDCEIAHLGTYGVCFGMGSKDCRLERCHLHDLGAGGVRIGEGSDPPSEAAQTSRNVVHNCFIHDGGRIFPGAVGAWIGKASHNAISHCEICDLDYTGVSVGWSWGYAPSSANHNIIEYNHIHDIGRGVLNDLGGIYTLGISPGTVERHNHIHDAYSWVFGGWGIYTDEGSTDILIEDNVVHDTSSGGFHQHYGKENVLRNNIFAFSREGQLRRSREEEHVSFTFEGNLVLSKDQPFLIVGWGNGNYRIDRNLYWDYDVAEPEFFAMTFAEWQAKGRDVHSIMADPLCFDPDRRDFRLRPGSPAAKIGFREIDLSGVGLEGDPEWTALPRRVKRKPYAPSPSPAPLAIREDFESVAVGAPCPGATTSEEGPRARVRVTEEVAASGKRSLEFRDAPGLQHRYDPHIYFTPNVRGGTLVVRFALLWRKGAVLYHEWRDDHAPYRVGPSLWVDEAGSLSVAGKVLAKLEPDRWVRVEVTAGLGRRASGTWDLALALPGDPAPRRFQGLPCDPKCAKVSWLGFVSNADAETSFSIDDLEITPVP